MAALLQSKQVAGGGGGGSLPAVTSADNNDTLTVTAGVWVKQAFHNTELPVTTYLNDNTTATVGKTVPSVGARLQQVLHVSGTLAVNSSGAISFGRARIMPLGNNASFSTDNLLNIAMPANGVVIKGYGGASDYTVAGGVIVLPGYSTLFFVANIGSSNSSNVEGGFAIIGQPGSASFVAPANWIPIATIDGDNNTVVMFGQFILAFGDTLNTDTYRTGINTGGNYGVGGNLSVGGNVTITGTSTFTAAATFNAAATVIGQLKANAATASSSYVTGSFVCGGGAGFNGDVYVGNAAAAAVHVSPAYQTGAQGTINKLDLWGGTAGLGYTNQGMGYVTSLSTIHQFYITTTLICQLSSAGFRSNLSTAATSTNSGAIVTPGGAGIGGALYVGGAVVNTPLVGTGNRAVYSDATGSLTNTSSDRTMKSNLKPIRNALAQIMALRPVSYTWKGRHKKRLGPQREIGLIAQEVRAVVPEVVSANADGTLSVDYPHLVATLVASIQELEARLSRAEHLLRG